MGNKIATREAYGKALVKLSNINENVVVLDADLSKSTKTADFKAVAPERFINMGIAEANMMGVAAGLSTCGKYHMLVHLQCLQLEEHLNK